jgi:hypothetical protein
MLFSALVLICTGVVSRALPKFEDVLLKKSFSKVCLEKLCNSQELQYMKELFYFGHIS